MLPNQRPLKILVVDDNQANAVTLAMLLKVLGHEVTKCYDGLSAMEILQHRVPDLVLLDIGMPIMDGHEVCRAIRKTSVGRSMMIVAQTAWGSKEDRLKSADAGFDAHLVKPIDLKAFSEILEQATYRAA